MIQLGWEGIRGERTTMHWHKSPSLKRKVHTSSKETKLLARKKLMLLVQLSLQVYYDPPVKKQRIQVLLNK